MEMAQILFQAATEIAQTADSGWSIVAGPILQTGAIGAMLLIAIFAFIKKDKRLMDYQEKMQNEQREVNRRLIDEIAHGLSASIQTNARIEETVNSIRADQMARKS